MTTSTLQVKVYRNNEIRRFHLETGEGNRFGFRRMVNKVKQLYPDLDVNRVKFLWKDNDGEFVAMSSGEELMEAVKNLPAENRVLRVHLMDIGDSDYAKQEEQQKADEKREKEEEKEDRDPTLHPLVVCDGCEGQIRGIRYKCLTCPDFDLCTNCMEKSPHDDHPVIRIVAPSDRSWIPAFFAVQAAASFAPSPPFGPHFPFGRHPPGFGFGFGPRGHHVRCHRGRGPHCNESAKAEDQKQQQNGNKVDDKKEELVEDEIVRNLSEVLESVLGAFGGVPIKIEVESDKLDKNQKEQKPEAQETKPTETPTTDSASGGFSAHQDIKISAALNYMHAMGYRNDGGWLTRLLEEKKGDISAVLDVLHPKPQ